jgi:GNAT superfamily N-acetyltransferase
VIDYRPFRNTDSPALVELWRRAAASRPLVQPLSLALFEQLVLARPFFDRLGLVVAVQAGEPIGFAHAGFGPVGDGPEGAPARGSTLLVVAPPPATQEVALALLSRCEEYLRQRGATVVYGGAADPFASFYLGLYGGSEAGGIPDSDPSAQDMFRAASYVEAGRWAVLRRDLASLRPIVDRTQIQIRRRAIVEARLDPPYANWWQAATLGAFDRTVFEFRWRERQFEPGPSEASLTCWEMDPLSAHLGVRAVGLVSLFVQPQSRRQGLATFLLGEALRQLHQQGVAMAEARANRQDFAAIDLFRKLGFVEVDQAVLFAKQ